MLVEFFRQNMHEDFRQERNISIELI